MDRLVKPTPREKRAWKKHDGDKFEEVLKQTVAVLTGLSLNSTFEIDRYVRLLVRGAQEAVEKSIPLARPSFHDKDLWRQEGDWAVEEASRLR